MLEDHKSGGVLFLKPDSLKNFRHTTNAMMRLIFLHSKCHLLHIQAFSIATLCLGHFFEWRAQGWFHDRKKIGFFLEISFFVQNLKNP